MKETLILEADQLRFAIMKNSKDTKHDIKMVKKDIDSLDEDIEYLDERIKENQLKSCENQIQVETLKDLAHDDMDTFNHIQNELTRIERSVTITNQYNRRENLVIDLTVSLTIFPRMTWKMFVWKLSTI